MKGEVVLSRPGNPSRFIARGNGLRYNNYNRSGIRGMELYNIPDVNLTLRSDWRVKMGAMISHPWLRNRAISGENGD
jgi:hypothetical protein